MGSKVKEESDVRARKKEILDKIDEAQREYNSIKQTYDYIKNDENYDPTTGYSKIELSKLRGGKQEPVKENVTATPPKTTTTAPVTTSEVKAPRVSGTKKSSSIPSSLVFKAPTVTGNEDLEEVVVPGGSLSPNQIAAAKSQEEKAAADAAALSKTLPSELPKTTTSPKPPKKGLADYIGNIDPTAIAAGMQVLEGKKLIQSGKRPVDVSKIDPAWNAAVERAQREAAYGYTPEQRAMLEQQRINALNDARFAGRNLAGGSASTAYQQERQAINEGWANALQLKSADQQLRMQKQQYADQAVRDRAAFLDMQRRRAYGDAMDTYNINQESGSALVGAGVRNLIGAYRYQKELDAQEKAAKIAGAPVYNG
jgi:hypothetical protein